MSANDELQAHTCEKMLEFYGNQSKTSKNKMLEIKNTSKEISDLTEQWKKGELERGWYYIKTLLRGRYVVDFYYGNDVDRWLDRYDEEIKEVLAPVPSYDEWVYLHKARNDAHEIVESLTKENKQLRKWCEEFNALDVAKENQQLKKLLKECQEHLCYHHCERYTRELSDRIDNAIGEK